MAGFDKRFFDNLSAITSTRSRLLTGSISSARAVSPIESTVSVGKNIREREVNPSFVEAAFVYSNILVQEEGAFEVPTTWPSSNTYAGFTFPTGDLPKQGDASLTQRRVHAFVYWIPEQRQFMVHQLLTLYEKPFDAVPIRFPAASGLFAPSCSLVVDSAFSGSQLQQILDNFVQAYGI